MEKIRKSFVALLILVSSLHCFFCLAEEKNTQSVWLEQYLNDGWKIESLSECGEAGAAILSRDGQKLLAVRKGEITVENAKAAEPDGTTVMMDTEDTLFLAHPNGWNGTTHYCFTYNGMRWLMRDIRFIGPYSWEDETGHDALEEYVLNVGAEQISPVYLTEDENENILWQKKLAAYPNVLTEDDLDLASWDPWDSPVYSSGYSNHENKMSNDSIRHRLFDALKAGTFFSEYEYADGLIQGNVLQFIADRSDGQRVLLCSKWQENSELEFVESTPLPAGTTIGNENFTENLLIPELNGGPYIQCFADGTWGVSCMVTRDGGMYFMGQNWICDSTPYLCQSVICYGEHPWSDITAIDWLSLPPTLAEAQSHIDTSCWAMPDNSNPQDRLHLREKPDQESRSLAKFYNGTPVQILKNGKEWTKVRIGNMTGYMMTKYLAIGEDMKQSHPYLSGKTPRNWLIHMARMGDRNRTRSVCVPEFFGYNVIGLADGEWWIVWNANENSFGMVRDSEMWDGNG